MSGEDCIKVALFTENKALIDQCQSVVSEKGADLAVFRSFVEPADPKLLDYLIIIVDIEHGQENGLRWVEALRGISDLNELPLVLCSAFLPEGEMERLQRVYPGTVQFLIQMPAADEQISTTLGYFLDDKQLQKRATVQKIAQRHEPKEESVDEHASLKALYERQLLKEKQQDIPGKHEGHGQFGDVEQISDVDTLRRMLALKDGDIDQLSAALVKTQELLTHAYASIDRQNHELAESKRTQEDTTVRVLTLEDELQRIEKVAERDRLKMMEDFQIRLSQKELLEADHGELQKRFETFKRRMAKEVKQVREHEQSLERQLEMMRHDTQLLLKAKDDRILELAQKIESLYEHIGRLNERIRGSEVVVTDQQDRQSRVLKALRLASSLLEELSEEKKAS